MHGSGAVACRARMRGLRGRRAHARRALWGHAPGGYAPQVCGSPSRRAPYFTISSALATTWETPKTILEQRSNNDTPGHNNILNILNILCHLCVFRSTGGKCSPRNVCVLLQLQRKNRDIFVFVMWCECACALCRRVLPPFSVSFVSSVSHNNVGFGRTAPPG